jgi:hypothetical protein
VNQPSWAQLQIPSGNLTRSVDSSKRLDHFLEKLLLCHLGNLLVEGEAFHDLANILGQPTEVVRIGRNGQGRHLDISLDRANLKVTCAAQNADTDAMRVSH